MDNGSREGMRVVNKPDHPRSCNLRSSADDSFLFGYPQIAQIFTDYFFGGLDFRHIPEWYSFKYENGLGSRPMNPQQCNEYGRSKI
jgi:hypothetical protein